MHIRASQNMFFKYLEFEDVFQRMIKKQLNSSNILTVPCECLRRTNLWNSQAVRTQKNYKNCTGMRCFSYTSSKESRALYGKVNIKSFGSKFMSGARQRK